MTHLSRLHFPLSWGFLTYGGFSVPSHRQGWSSPASTQAHQGWVHTRPDTKVFAPSLSPESEDSRKGEDGRGPPKA